MRAGHGQLALPFAVAAGGGAAIVSGATRWWLLGELHGPTAVVVAMLCGAIIGALTSHWLRLDGTAGLRFRVSLAVLATGPFAALAIAGMCDSELLGWSALAGATLSVCILPIVFGATWLAERAIRSRERSLVGHSDRRAPWRLTAAWLAIAATVGIALCSLTYDDPRIAGTLWWSSSDRVELAQIPAVVSWCGCLLAAVVATLDLRALRIARSADGEGLRPANGDVEVDDVLDLGVGDTAWIEQVGGMSSYRTAAIERIAFRGDRVVAPAMLREGANKSLATLAFAVGVALVTSWLRARI